MSSSVTRRHHRTGRWFVVAVTLCSAALVAVSAVRLRAGGVALQATSFPRLVLAPALPEAPFDLRFFSGAVKTNSRGEIIEGFDSDPVKRLVGAESAGMRAGLERFTKILFAVDYFTGRPNKGDRLDPTYQV